MSGPVTRPHEPCPATWELLDPNDEDRAAGRTHLCVRHDGHDGNHRCHCGEELPLIPPGTRP